MLALAISLFLGKRRGHGTTQLAYRPHSTVLVVLGTVFLWIGWFGFNGGVSRFTIIYILKRRVKSIHF